MAFAHCIGIRPHHQRSPSPADFGQPPMSDRVFDICPEDKSAAAVGIRVGGRMSVFWTKRVP